LVKLSYSQKLRVAMDSVVCSLKTYAAERSAVFVAGRAVAAALEEGTSAVQAESAKVTSCAANREPPRASLVSFGACTLFFKC